MNQALPHIVPTELKGQYSYLGEYNSCLQLNKQLLLIRPIHNTYASILQPSSLSQVQLHPQCVFQICKVQPVELLH